MTTRKTKRILASETLEAGTSNAQMMKRAQELQAQFPAMAVIVNGDSTRGFRIDIKG